jgi:hypothetical protein
MPFGRVRDVRRFPLSYPKDTVALPRAIWVMWVSCPSNYLEPSSKDPPLATTARDGAPGEPRFVLPFV